MHLSYRHSTHSDLKFVFVLRQPKKLSGSKLPAAVLHHFPTTQAEPGLPIFAHRPFTGAASSRFDLAPRFISQSPLWNLVNIHKLNENSQHVPTSITCNHCWWRIEFLPWSSRLEGLNWHSEIRQLRAAHISDGVYLNLQTLQEGYNDGYWGIGNEQSSHAWNT